MEKVYRSMKAAGASNLTIGIILMVVGLTTGHLPGGKWIPSFTQKE